MKLCMYRYVCLYLRLGVWDIAFVGCTILMSVYFEFIGHQAL